MIEHLPQELRDRFTEMREMDLSVQNNMDSLDKRARIMFAQCRRGEMGGNRADEEFESIRKDYYRVLEDSDEKVQLAGQMYDLVNKYLRRLDDELYKFKCELEVDCNGITEKLEKNFKEQDASSNNGVLSQKENRYFGSVSSITTTPTSRPESRYRPKPEKRRDSSTPISGAPLEKRQALSSSSISTTPVRSNTPNITHQVHSTSSAQAISAYNLQHIAAGNAIAAAASQAIAATQQMQQGRRTASLKASYEAIHGVTSSGSSQELLINRELAGATHNAIQAVERETSNFGHQRRHKKKLTSTGSNSSSVTVVPTLVSANSSSVSALLQSSTSSNLLQSQSSHLSNSLSSIDVLDQSSTSIGMTNGAVVNEQGMIVEQTPDGEWTYDPNEPRYCICNQVSYGDMVACDNEDVRLIFYWSIIMILF